MVFPRSYPKFPAFVVQADHPTFEEEHVPSLCKVDLPNSFLVQMEMDSRSEP